MFTFQLAHTLNISPKRINQLDDKQENESMTTEHEQ